MKLITFAMARKNRRWTIKDLEYMRVMYMVLTRKELAKKLGVREIQVRDAMERHGISKPWRKKHKKWTAAELDIIKEKYQTTSSEALAAELRISKSALWGTVQRYGLMKRERISKKLVQMEPQSGGKHSEVSFMDLGLIQKSS